jgi:hypothetical protein
MTPGTGWNPTDKFLNRVKRAYIAAFSESPTLPFRSVWGSIAAIQTEIHQALTAESNDALRVIFSDPASSDLFYGLDNLCASFLSQDLDFSPLIAGADELLKKVQAFDAIGFDLRFPTPFRGEWGTPTEYGVATYRAVLALYQTLLILRLAGRDAKVIEIGPGLGRTALHCDQAGIRNYTTVDRPMGMVAQACFLGATLGENKIWFSTDECASDEKIRVISFADARKLNEHFSVAINVDSITEMPLLTGLAYGKWIRQTCDIFVSINRSYHRSGMGRIRWLCFPFDEHSKKEFPLRPGYHEEIFRFSGGQRKSRTRPVATRNPLA